LGEGNSALRLTGEAPYSLFEKFDVG
jgi:hypothetical protein